MRPWLLRLLDIGTDPTDDEDLVLRKRTAVGTTLVLCLGFGVFLVAGVITSRPEVVALAVLTIVGEGVNLLLYRNTRRVGPQVVINVLLGYLAVVGGVIMFGGLVLSPGNVAWGILAPLGAILLLGGRAGWPTYAGLVLIVLGAALVDPLISEDRALPHEVALVLSVIDVLGPALVAVLLVLFIDGQRLEARRQSDALLRNVLPEPIARRLKGGERVIADHYDAASVLFADIVNFTPISESKPPQELVAILNGLFTEFDRLADDLGLEKIKTIGDAYMVVAGVPEPRDDHALAAMDMALAMHARVLAHPRVDGRRLEIRIGIASGPMVAGVIGERKFSYDLWGDTVNTASRMESSGIPGCIQVTEETRRLLAGRYPFQRREGVEVKGKGPMTTWTLDPTDLTAG